MEKLDDADLTISDPDGFTSITEYNCPKRRCCVSGSSCGELEGTSKKNPHGDHLGVSKIGGKPPKWMVKIMENPIKMDDLGVPPF